MIGHKTLTQEESENSVGGSLVGYVSATREEIESVFGQATYTDLSLDEKVSIEWVVQFENGIIARIYDWKRYEEGTPLMNELYEWHIGAREEAAVPFVAKAVQKDVTGFDAGNPPTFRRTKFKVSS